MSKRDKNTSQPYVVGARSVTEVLRHRSDGVVRLLVSKKNSKNSALRIAEDAGIQVGVVEDEFFEEVAPGVTHQGLALELKTRREFSVKELSKEVGEDAPSVLVALDEVFDPQNLGSILRASECFGVDGVLWSKNRGVSITPAVTKVSVGASELVRLAPVSNLRTALKELKKAGYWICVSSVQEGSQPLHEFDFPERCVIVLGSEGKGVQQLIQKEADFSIAVPMAGHIDSLNVSQASAVFLAAYRARHPISISV